MAVGGIKSRNIVSAMLLAVVMILLLPSYTLSFFGNYVGKFTVFGMNMEHEWVGVGMLVAGCAIALMMYKKISYLHWAVPIIGVFLWLSDFVSGSIFINLSGSLFSILFGILIGTLIDLSWI